MGCLLPAKFCRITGCTDIGQKLLIWRPTCQGFRICITCIGRKWIVWPGKLICYWKGPKNRLFRGDTIQVMSLWRELEAKPVTEKFVKSVKIRVSFIKRSVAANFKVYIFWGSTHGFSTHSAFRICKGKVYIIFLSELFLSEVRTGRLNTVYNLTNWF